MRSSSPRTLVSASVLALACGAAAPGARAQCLDALSEGRFLVAGAAAGGQAFFAGGYVGAQTVTTRVDVLDLASGTWSTKSLSTRRGAPAALSIGTRVLFAGGEVPNAPFFAIGGARTVDMWDVATGVHQRAQLSIGRWRLAATSVGSLAIFAGGYHGGAPPFGMLDVVDVWNVASDTWTTRALSAPRSALAATSVGPIALFAGGLCLGGGDCLGAQPEVPGYSARVDLWDLANDVWSSAVLSEARGELAATSVGSIALFAGGRGRAGVSATVDLWDATTSQWSTASLSVARTRPLAFSVGGYACFAGGSDALDRPSDVVDVYEAASGRWSVMHLGSERAYGAVAVAGEEVLLAGGLDAGGLTSGVERLRGGLATSYAAGTSGCPCGNAGGAQTGCANSTGAGAALALACATQGPGVGRVEATGLVPQQAVVLLAGTTSGAPSAFGDGLLATGGALRRVGARVSDAAGAASWPAAALGSALPGGPWSGGAARHVQAWYRDPASPCGSGSNWTNGLRALVWS